jgi:xanthine dehydrogenase accessory factor
MNIFGEILSALQSEEQIMLATIISTKGSTPAASLSKMIIKQGGMSSVGTIGGGCMEGEVLLQASRLYGANKSEILTFSLDEDDIENGLICGGSLEVLIEPISKNQIPLFKAIQSMVDDGEDCILVTLLSSEKKVEEKLFFCRNARVSNEWIPDTHINNSITQLLDYSTTSSFQQSISNCHRHNETIRLKLESDEIILEPIMGNPSLIIFGGGHVSKYITRIAAMVGFRVTIVDDREKYSNPQRFPEAIQTVVADFEGVFQKLSVKPSTYIVIVTHGHQYDEIVLEQAIKTSANYIGMIGSKRKIMTTFEHLLQRGVLKQQIDKVHAPIGIDIKAVTAEEIAVSIVAELVHIRRLNR